MAHLARLGALTDELVSLLTSTNAKSDPAKFFPYREAALRTLRHNNYPRTNQFDISSQTEGLEEKFRVYNEDLLADALKERLDELSKKEVKWAPEILHLLLELSDRPISKSKLEHLDFLKDFELGEEPALKWKDLVAEDPLLREKGIWRNVDFGAESSDEDGFEDSRSELSRSTEVTCQSSVDEAFNRRPEEFLVEVPDDEDLEKLRSAQFWKKYPSVNGIKLETVKKPITELQAKREVLYMLSGFPTSLFDIKDEAYPAVVTPSKNYVMKHASNGAFYNLIAELADQGSAITSLRLWLKRRHSIPLLQILQSFIGDQIMKLDSQLSTLQQQMVTPAGDVMVSLLSVRTQINFYLRPLIRIYSIVNQLETERYYHAFRYLEILYDETCTSQMAGDDEMYTFMGRMFFECFQVYLRPMRVWMEDGELGKDDKVFFVSELAGEVELASLWQSRFKIRKTQAGVLHAPRFLHAAANKIFTTGKSIVVLKYLNLFDSLQSMRSGFEPSLDFDTVCKSAPFELAPFSELFNVAFDAWVQSKHQHASSTVHKALFDSCGLHDALDALSHLYYFADGTSASAFTNPLFDKLDTLNPAWNDRFTLTELAQTTFGSIPYIQSDHLCTSILSLPRKFQDVGKCRKSVKVLRIVELKYRLSWPIQIIVAPDSIPSYQAIFTFLFQIRRSAHILTRQALKADTPNNSSSTDERALYYALRSRLLWFTQSLYYYLTSVVIEPNSRAMRQKLNDAVDVDSMISVHDSCIKTVRDQALLGSKLEMIHKTILKVLDLSIKLEDAQAAIAASSKQMEDQQREMMDMSMASLGLQVPQRRISQFSKSTTRALDPESSEEEDGFNVDLSILTSIYDADETESYFEKLRKMKGEFGRLVRFAASGLRGVARAGAGGEGRVWDILGEMLETGLEAGHKTYR